MDHLLRQWLALNEPLLLKYQLTLVPRTDPGSGEERAARMSGPERRVCRVQGDRTGTRV